VQYGRARQRTASKQIPRVTDALALLSRSLGALSDGDLQPLFAACDAVRDAAPGLIAWLDHAFGWEQDRRAGFDYPLRGPMAAIPDDEVVESIAVVDMMAITFRGSREHDGKAVAALFDLVAEILRAEAERPETLQ
jgi:hypothetical protein